MSKTLDKVVAVLSSRLIDLEDYLEDEKALKLKTRIGLAIDRLEEAIEDAESAQSEEYKDEIEDSEDEDE